MRREKSQFRQKSPRASRLSPKPARGSSRYFQLSVEATGSSSRRLRRGWLVIVAAPRRVVSRWLIAWWRCDCFWIEKTDWIASVSGGVEIPDVWEHILQQSIVFHAIPQCQFCSVLASRHSRNQATSSDIQIGIRHKRWEIAVNVATLNSTADSKLIATPCMVTATTIR